MSYAPKFIGSGLDYDGFMKEPINELTPMIKINTQDVAINAVKTKQLIVGSVSPNGELSFSSNPTVHSFTTDARTEAKRLAKMSPGRMYVIAQLVGAELVPNNSVSI